MNKIILMGRLTKDAEIRYTSGQTATAVAKFNLAVDRRIKRDGQPTADFFNCVAFGKTAELIDKYIAKGSKIVLEGELQNNNWEKDGVKHYDMQILVGQIEFAESKNSGTAPKTDSDGFMQIPDGADEELPFM